MASVVAAAETVAAAAAAAAAATADVSAAAATAAVSFGALGGQAGGLLDSPGAALADASFGSGGHLAELVAVLFVLVHLVVRDSLAGHAAYLRFVSKAQR